MFAPDGFDDHDHDNDDDDDDDDVIVNDVVLTMIIRKMMKMKVGRGKYGVITIGENSIKVEIGIHATRQGKDKVRLDRSIWLLQWHLFF